MPQLSVQGNREAEDEETVLIFPLYFFEQNDLSMARQCNRAIPLNAQRMTADTLV